MEGLMTTTTDRVPTPWLDLRTVWRWHFYAGLFCVPFILILALTGSIYLFKPQVEAWLDSPYDGNTIDGPLAAPSMLVAQAVEAVPGSRFQHFILPQSPGDAVRVIVRDADGASIRVLLHPVSGEVLLQQPESERLMAVIRDIHGELLVGTPGSLAVELAASWAIVMVLTGLYLWWPRDNPGLAGILTIRVRAGGRLFWRDLHSVVGLWVSFFALFLLLTALPWTEVWGDAFKAVREATGTAAVKQDWSQSRAAEAGKPAMTGEHVDHGSHASHGDHSHGSAAASAGLAQPAELDRVVATVLPLNLAGPVTVAPPKREGAPWAVRSQAQNRPLRVNLDLDGGSGQIVRREDFADRMLIDRVIGYGIAAHEGHLFGWVNQLLGVLTALGLITLAVSGVIMWWKRRPADRLGAPPILRGRALPAGFYGLLLILAVFLPLLTASLIIIALTERFLLARLPTTRRWLGLAG
jgi:uncharacterized iron-regulated membrane protein